MQIDLPLDGRGPISIPASDIISPILSMWLTLVLMYTGTGPLATGLAAWMACLSNGRMLDSFSHCSVPHVAEWGLHFWPRLDLPLHYTACPNALCLQNTGNYPETLPQTSWEARLAGQHTMHCPRTAWPVPCVIARRLRSGVQPTAWQTTGQPAACSPQMLASSALAEHRYGGAVRSTLALLPQEPRPRGRWGWRRTSSRHSCLACLRGLASCVCPRQDSL